MIMAREHPAQPKTASLERANLRRIRIMLHEFIAAHREEILSRCRMKVATRSVPPPSQAETGHGVPLFLDQLIDALRLGLLSSAEIGQTALLHGHDLLLQGFTVSQVVHDYGDVCQAITELAVELKAPIPAEDFRTLNRCLDDAIAGAVTEYGRGRNQSTLDGETVRGSERLGFFAHELRNLTNTAILAFEALQKGNVGVAGSTAAVLHRSLIGTRDLIGRSLAEVRLTQGIENLEPFLVSTFIDELAPAATLSADVQHVTLSLPPIEDGLAIEVDREVLRAVVMNLLQNAFKFTKPGTTVTLRVGANPERVLIEIEDACGGLPRGNVKDLFRPFEQRGADRSGLGLGLAFSRWAVEASHGRIYARNLPEVGCVFTIDLPRCARRPRTTGTRPPSGGPRAAKDVAWRRSAGRAR
jgi:signal transduction histidine kinase